MMSDFHKKHNSKNKFWQNPLSIYIWTSLFLLGKFKICKYMYMYNLKLLQLQCTCKTCWRYSYSQSRSSVPPKILLMIDYLKNVSVSHSRYWCQIQIGIPPCVMSSEYFTRTSLYLVRLKIFEWIEVLRRYLHQIQGNWAGRNFITESRVNSPPIMHARMRRWIWNLQLPMDSTFE